MSVLERVDPESALKAKTVLTPFRMSNGSIVLTPERADYLETIICEALHALRNS